MQQRKISISEWPEVLSRYQDSGVSQKAVCLRCGSSDAYRTEAVL